MFRGLKLFLLTGILSMGLMLTGCGKEAPKEEDNSYDGKNYIRESRVTDAYEDPEGAAEELEVLMTLDLSLSVPTYVYKVDGLWFIVDCYHNKVIYTDSLDTPIQAWNVMCSDAVQPHTMASDGKVYLIDDTENNRVLIYEKVNDKFVETQIFDDIGIRPHFSVYDEKSDTFYVWSSESGELYCFRHTPDSSRMYLTEIRSIKELENTYVRSFTIVDDDILFTSGLSTGGTGAKVLQCDLKSLDVKKSYPVPDALAGMVQITPIEDMYYITISTDITGNQDYATLIRTQSLNDLSEGEYEEVYADYFIGGGTPYNISQVEDTYFLTEHRLTGHSIWSFKVEDGMIKDVKALF